MNSLAKPQTQLTTISLPERLRRLINENNIDWSNKLPFLPNGEVNHSEAKNLGYYKYGLRPIPVIIKDSEEYSELTEMTKCWIALCKPAPAKEATYELKKLSCHCAMQNRDVNDFAMMLDDYLTDLEEYPIDLIQNACRIYRNDSSKESDFFPRPGKLKVLMANDLSLRKLTLSRLQMLLHVANNPPEYAEPPEAEEVIKMAKKRMEAHDKLAKRDPSRKPDNELFEFCELIIKSYQKEGYYDIKQAQAITDKITSIISKDVKTK